MKITARTTASAGLPEDKTDHIFWDEDLTGFGLRIRLGGDRVRKTFVAQYRAHGRTRRVLIGPVEKLGAEQARKQAEKVLAKVVLGEDPQAERLARRQRAAHTLRSVVEDYLAAKQPVVRFNTFRELKRFLLAGPHFKPLHAMPIDGITRRDVAARVAKITTEHGGPSAARARAALSALYTWAMGEGIAEHNPVVGTNKPADSKPRERALSDSEIAAIWHAAGEAGIFGKIVKLLLLTGCRRMEICGMCWCEIDESGVWRLPGDRTKNGRPHTLPLPALARDIIATVPHVVGRERLFGQRSGLGFSKWVAKRDFDARLGDKVAKWTLHDLRRTCATGMADIGVQPHIIEAVLNHVSGHKLGVAGIYNRSSYEREVRAALAFWSDHVRALVEGGEAQGCGLSTTGALNRADPLGGARGAW
jgi:integrase